MVNITTLGVKGEWRTRAARRERIAELEQLRASLTCDWSPKGMYHSMVVMPAIEDHLASLYETDNCGRIFQ